MRLYTRRDEARQTATSDWVDSIEDESRETKRSMSTRLGKCDSTMADPEAMAGGRMQGLWSGVQAQSPWWGLEQGFI